MKSTTIKKVGSVVAGTAFLGAALSAPVMAGMDSAGLDKGFFYDESFNPIVQIVVGEKVGNALDFVAAGNIAATVGNLAYMTKSVSGGDASGTAEGQVVITTAARGAIGDYVQDTDINEDSLADFYDDDAGFFFEGEKTYERGDFTSYTLSCDQQTRTEAGLLMEGTYNNVHCLFCRNLCLEALENPSHDMEETIEVDSAGIYYYEDGLDDDDSEALKMAIEKDAISYKVDTDYIPLETIKEAECDDSSDCYIDFEYRGKMILFGEEYYVKDIDDDEIYLAKGKVIDDVTSEGFAAEYEGYKFRIDNLMFSEEFVVAGIVLDVQKPDGTIVQTQISKMANSPPIDGKLELAGVTAQESAKLQTASIIIYDLESEVVLKDGEDLEIGGEVKNDWQVTFETVTSCKDDDDSDCDIGDYDDMEISDDALLKSIEIAYTHSLDGDEALEKDESLPFPNNFRLSFKGYLTNDYEEAPCSGAGEGNIVVEKGDENYQLVISFTGDDNNRYNDVRLDEGPFQKNDLFIANGVVYNFDSYSKDKNSAGDADDTVEITLDPQVRGNRIKIKDMQRYCDPDDEGTAGTFTGMDCEDIGDEGEIVLRKLALTDAMKDDDPTEYENDQEYTVDVYDLFIKEDSSIKDDNGNALDIVFDDSDNSILFVTDAAYNATTENLEDANIAINSDMVGTFDDFEVDGYELEFEIVQEANLLEDLDATTYYAADDINGDGDDDDTLVVFTTDDGPVVVDLSDRNYDDDVDSSYSTSIALKETAVTGDDVIELDEDIDTLLITPEGGDKFTLDWGSDDRLDAVELCHPEDKVDSTYFVGTTEEETIAESVITKADEGKEVSAGCCTFTVSKFDVSVSDVSTGDVSTTVVNPIVGNLVVSESAADTSKNLVIIGGPAVNEMSTVSADDVEAASGHYLVKKDGKKLIVAGWTADDTQTGGNELIKWLKENVH